MSGFAIPSRRRSRYVDDHRTHRIHALNLCFPGRIGIVDHDVVDVSNLQRQILHSEVTVGLHKAISAARAIEGCVLIHDTLPVN